MMGVSMETMPICFQMSVSLYTFTASRCTYIVMAERLTPSKTVASIEAGTVRSLMMVRRAVQPLKACQLMFVRRDGSVIFSSTVLFMKASFMMPVTV